MPNPITGRQEPNQTADSLQEILEGLPVGIAVLKPVRNTQSPDRRIVDFIVERANTAFQNSINENGDDCAGKLLTAVFKPVSESGMLARCIMGVELSQEQEFELPMARHNRSEWYRISLAPRGDGLVLALFDITETKKAQLSHHSQAELLRTISDSTPAGLVLLDAVREKADREKVVDFRYRMTNHMNSVIMGYPTEDLRGKLLFETFPRFRGTEFEKTLRLVLETGENHQLTLTNYSEQSNKWFDAQFISVGDGVLITLADVTELKQQQQALELANIELQQSNDNLQQFAYVASHDLQEPLRKIQSFGELLTSHYAEPLGTNGSDLIGRMQASAGRMSVLIKDLLQYSRITTHRAPFEFIPLSELLTEAVEDLQVMIEESKASIEWAELPNLFGDRRQLHQLFMNLLSNAIKFRLPDVTPHVQITARQLRLEDLPSTLATSNVLKTSGKLSIVSFFHEINITDNGIGFDEKYNDRIFQVFQRLHGRTVYSGTGVGLAICKKVAENHQGFLIAKSQPGAGATFSLYLPIPPEQD